MRIVWFSERIPPCLTPDVRVSSDHLPHCLDHCRQDFTSLPVNDHARDSVERGGLKVDDAEAGMFCCKGGNICRRVDHEGGADYDHHVAVHRLGHCPLDSPLRQHLAKEDHVGLEYSPATAERWDLPGLCLQIGIAGWNPLPAFLAAGPPGVSMELHNVGAPCILVEVVDVLGDHRLYPPLLLEPGNGQMGGIRLRLEYIQGRGMPAFEPVLPVGRRIGAERMEIEVESLEQAQEAARASADIILLDNMTPARAKECYVAVKAIDQRIRVEVSGGITPKNARTYARYADVISIGALTHSAAAMHFSMHIQDQ